MSNDDAKRAEAAIEEAKRRSPVATTLLETLHAGLNVTISPALRSVIEDEILRASATVWDRGAADYTEADAMGALMRCGLLSVETKTKATVAGVELTLRRVFIAGAWHWLSQPLPVASRATHAVMMEGREVARIVADNDFHARAMVPLLFGDGTAARSYKLAEPTEAEVFKGFTNHSREALAEKDSRSGRLMRYPCSCGWAGVWMKDVPAAEHSYSRHVEAHTSPEARS